MFELIAFIFVCLLMLFAVKNYYTLIRRTEVSEAIRAYNLNYMRKDFSGFMDSPDLYENMEPYYKTLFRFWDWSNGHIVDGKTYRLIRHYL